MRSLTIELKNVNAPEYWKFYRLLDFLVHYTLLQIL